MSGSRRIAAAAALAAAVYGTRASAAVQALEVSQGSDAAPAASAGTSAAGRTRFAAFSASDRPLFLQNNNNEDRRLLMRLLDMGGLARPLDEARIRVYGHVEGSYTYNFDDPELDLNFGRLLDIEHADPTLNQVSLNVERLVDARGGQFDVGGRMEWLYGGDARFTHANGLFDHQADDGGFFGDDEQIDLLQLYADVAVPVGTGMRVRIGKFTYFRAIDPNTSPFYSRSFAFNNPASLGGGSGPGVFFGALPNTLTGVIANYNVSDRLTVEGGVVRGWDQAAEDNNGSVSFAGQVGYQINDPTRLTVKLITGPELENDGGAFRTAVDAVLSYDVSENLTLFANGIFGRQAGDVDALWYGASGYALYDLNRYLSVNGRLEVYFDEDGVTTGLSQTLSEATVGLTITPFPDDAYGGGLKVRPELRYDYSSERFFNAISEADRDYDQFTFGIDAIFNF